MPDAAPTPCRKPGCNTASTDAYCAEHADEGTRQANAVRRQHDARRGTAAQRGYGHRWRQLRRHILRRDPICKCKAPGCGCGGACVRPSEEIDHVRPREAGGSDDTSNLQGLCKPCHSYKTAHQDGGFGHSVQVR